MTSNHNIKLSNGVTFEIYPSFEPNRHDVCIIERGNRFVFNTTTRGVEKLKEALNG
jgi:hypothetical protein